MYLSVADDYPTLPMWVGSLPGTAPTVAYDDDVIFLGTGTFTKMLEISKKYSSASAVQNQCLLVEKCCSYSMLGIQSIPLLPFSNLASAKRLGHEHGHTKKMNEKQETEISQFLEKKICHGLHTVSPVALAALVALFGSIFA